MAATFYAKDFEYSVLVAEIAHYESLVESLVEFSAVAAVAPVVGDAWNLFYLRHSNKFFHPRSYLPACFPVVLSSSSESTETLTILECGSGSGANVLSLLNVLSSANIIAADASVTSLDALALNPACAEAIKSKQLTLLLWDITMPPLLPLLAAAPLPALALLFFTLSSISPSLHLEAVKNVCAVLQPKGQLCFRDYGYGDIAQLRGGSNNKGSTLILSRATHRRPDGTLSHYFTLFEVAALMEAAGFAVLELDYHLVENVNRKTGARLKRVFLHCLARRI